ncbi:UNVERIFIED_ORG: hypothetical protein ABIB19_003705 [Arthrobacter sp. UYEF10]
MSHGFILTDQDAAPEGATFNQDILELSLLTMHEKTGAADFSWDNQDQKY